MARNFPDSQSIVVPLRTTWEERWELMDDTGAPVDLAGFEFRMQVRDRATGDLLLAIESTGAPAYATITVADGTVDIAVPAEVIGAVSPENVRIKGAFDAELYIPGAAEYVIPLLRGTVSFQPRVTVLAP